MKLEGCFDAFFSVSDASHMVNQRDKWSLESNKQIKEIWH